MRCAVVDGDGVVVNIIVAELTDPAPDGCVLYEMAPNVVTNPGELWADRVEYVAPEVAPEVEPDPVVEE